MAVVKANAYGHGAVAVSRYLALHGARWFGVATLEEAVELRRVGIRANVVMLGTFFPPQAKSAIEHRIQVTVSSIQHLNALNRASSRKAPAVVHLKFDTGMGRMGFSCEEAEGLARRWARGGWKHLVLQGLCSHLASAEDLECVQNRMQSTKFQRVRAAFETVGIDPPVRHLANSAGGAFHPSLRQDLVRAGIALYGYEPRIEKFRPMGTGPALSLRTRVLHIRPVPRNTWLGYQGTFVTRRRSVVVTLPIGYADGFNRRFSFSNRAPCRTENVQSRPMRAIIRGELAPVIGRVSMDLIFLDVTDVKGVRVGDEVILLGCSGSLAITAADWAAYLGTIPYEVLCGIGSRVYRVYKE